MVSIENFNMDKPTIFLAWIASDNRIKKNLQVYISFDSLFIKGKLQ